MEGTQMLENKLTKLFEAYTVLKNKTDEQKNEIEGLEFKNLELLEKLDNQNRASAEKEEEIARLKLELEENCGKNAQEMENTLSEKENTINELNTKLSTACDQQVEIQKAMEIELKIKAMENADLQKAISDKNAIIDQVNGAKDELTTKLASYEASTEEASAKIDSLLSAIDEI